jgi:hypothetical protein
VIPCREWNKFINYKNRDQKDKNRSKAMADSDWRYFYGDGEPHPEVGKSLTEAGKKEIELPASPPWRKFRDWRKMTEKEQGEIDRRWRQIQELSESDENERGWTKGKNFRLPANVTEPEREEEIKQAKAVLNAVNAGL